MRAEVFLVERGGLVIAEPTGGLPRFVPGGGPSQWWATTADRSALPGGRLLVNIDVASTMPDRGSVGRVVRIIGELAQNSDRKHNALHRDLDRAFDLLGRVPDAWKPYELRAGVVPEAGWDAFVGTLLPVPDAELDRVFGRGWRRYLRVEAWLNPVDGTDDSPRPP